VRGALLGNTSRTQSTRSPEQRGYRPGQPDGPVRVHGALLGNTSRTQSTRSPEQRGYRSSAAGAT
jgi:hypothetical protein